MVESDEIRSTTASSVVKNRPAYMRRTLQTVPTLVVMLAIAALGYFGHTNGWKVPKFAELTGQRLVDEEPWCDQHGVPEAECIACIGSLMPKGVLHGWCKEHGVHECLLHHPELAQLENVVQVSVADMDRAARAIALRPRTENDPLCKIHLRRIQFPSREAADRAGIDINLVGRGAITESVTTTGEILYDPTRVARLASRASGTVWRVEKKVGDYVKRGDVLAIVDAAEVGQAKAELIQAATQLDLHKKTYERLVGLGTVVAGKRVLEAETIVVQAEVSVQRASQSLVNLGIPISFEEVVQIPSELLKTKIQFLGLPTDISLQTEFADAAANLLPVLAPRDGTVVKRDVVAGEVIDTTRALFTVADTSRMWLMLSVPLEEARHVGLGQNVVFLPDGAETASTGVLTWISTEVDNQTRTLQVRGELKNDSGQLRNKTFGVGKIILREEEDAVVVPSSAIHWEGCCYVAFVRDKDYMKEGTYKVFHTRSVRPGVVMGGTTEVIAGLLPDEVVVTQGSAVLRAELLKGNLGAG